MSVIFETSPEIVTVFITVCAKYKLFPEQRGAPQKNHCCNLQYGFLIITEHKEHSLYKTHINNP